MNSKQKGKRGELELAHFLTDHGFPARRTQQFCGTEGNSDVTCDALAGFHIECKRVEKLSVAKAMAQAIRDCNGRIPLVAHRTNRSGWLAILSLEDLLKLAQRIGAGL